MDLKFIYTSYTSCLIVGSQNSNFHIKIDYKINIPQDYFIISIKHIDANMLISELQKNAQSKKIKNHQKLII